MLADEGVSGEVAAESKDIDEEMENRYYEANYDVEDDTNQLSEHQVDEFDDEEGTFDEEFEEEITDDEGVS